MLYRRFCGLEPGTLFPFEGAPRTTTPACDAKTLRARAAHCRGIAETFYDQSIVAELEMYARELDAEASALESSREADGQPEVTVLKWKTPRAGLSKR
jgi:hypothetical protein